MTCQMPKTSPWGEIERFYYICPGVFEVSTASHGGIMVDLSVADRMLSKEAQACGFKEGAYLCFEEDCDAPVAIRELLDQGLVQSLSVETFMEEDYSTVIDRSLQRWHPDYWKYREAKAH